MLAEMVTNKRVIILGPAPSITNFTPEFVEEYDVVVRVNKSVPVPDDIARHTGTRTDILYCCFSESQIEPDPLVVHPDVWKDHGVKLVVCPFPRKFKWMDHCYAKWDARNVGLPLEIMSDSDYDILAACSKCRPNTGFAAIWHLLRYPITELYIAGFTFYRQGYHPSYRRYNEEQIMDWLKRAGVHDPDAQLKYFYSMWQHDSRIFVDSALLKILQEI